MKKATIIFLSTVLFGTGAGLGVFTDSATASSHREAPFITEIPKSDGTDLYLFRSYETGRSDFVTVIANYLPLQDAYGGPNYFSLDPDALYEIHIDNNADVKEDMTFQFRFTNTSKNLALSISGQTVAVPLINIGGIGPGISDTANVNVIETYTAKLIRGNRRTGRARNITNAITASNVFMKPTDNIGSKSFSDYAAYANAHIYSITIPGCGTTGRMFVGQRKEGFFVNLGETFDLVNLNPLGSVSGESNTIDDKNITSIALELPISCVVRGSNTIIGAWTTSSLKRSRVLKNKPSFKSPATETGDWVQVSRLGNPLVNEVVIGLKDKNKFNASEPVNDTQFLKYVTNPSFAELLEILFPAVTAPNLFPRTDLVAIFLTGVTGVNGPAGTGEIMRLNTATAVTAVGSQDTLGVIAGDNAGYPNGRRPGDDVVDITLRATMGVLLSNTDAPSGQLAFTDGAAGSAADFDTTFPYLKTPIPGSN